MSTNVLTFPISRTRRAGHPCRPAPSGAVVVQFPRRSAGLAEQHLKRVGMLAAAAGWNCAAERDGSGHIAAILLSGGPEQAAQSEYLVCHSDRRLLLIQPQRSADWALVGTFAGLDALLVALAREFGLRLAGISER